LTKIAVPAITLDAAAIVDPTLVENSRQKSSGKTVNSIVIAGWNVLVPFVQAIDSKIFQDNQQLRTYLSYNIIIGRILNLPPE
jgi:hypothetical protein